MNPNLIGPVIGGIIFFFVQLGTNMGDQSGIIRLASLLISRSSRRNSTGSNRTQIQVAVDAVASACPETAPELSKVSHLTSTFSFPGTVGIPRNSHNYEHRSKTNLAPKD